MKRILVFLLTVMILTSASCSLFDNKKKEAIAVCQQSKVQFPSEDIFTKFLFHFFVLDEDATWLDFANMLAQKEPNKKFDWTAKATDEKGVFIVSFADKEGWGHRWEVTLNQQIVKHVNSNEYLARKYGFSRMSDSEEFKISSIRIDTLRLTKGSTHEIVYAFEGTVMNNTDHTFTNAAISGELNVIFEEKTVSGISGDEDGFLTKTSKSNPWRTGEEREFKLKTNGIDAIYADYTPPYVLFEIELQAEDPIGYQFDENIAEFDLAEKWARLREKE